MSLVNIIPYTIIVICFLILYFSHLEPTAGYYPRCNKVHTYLSSRISCDHASSSKFSSLIFFAIFCFFLTHKYKYYVEDNFTKRYPGIIFKPTIWYTVQPFTNFPLQNLYSRNFERLAALFSRFLTCISFFVTIINSSNFWVRITDSFTFFLFALRSSFLTYMPQFFVY